MNKKSPAIAVTGAAAAALLGAAACGSASAPAASTSSASPAARSGAERLMLTTHATGPTGTYTVIASGVFSGRGKATTQSARVLKVTIGSSTFLVHHANSTSNPVKPPTTNQQTCFLSVTTKAGAYSLSDGTGKYAGLTGGGQALITFSGKFAKKGGKCDFSQSARPVQGTTTTVVHAAGHATL